MHYDGPYVTLGGTDLHVSRIAFGCGFRGVSDSAQAERVLLNAMDSGINYFDCADLYQLRSGVHAEEVLGKTLRGRRSQVVITSKFGAPLPGQSAAGASKQYMMRAVEASLRRLQTDYIDVYMLHMPDTETTFEETMRAFEQLRRDGKIRYAGLCNHSAWQVTAMQELYKRIGGCPISVIQNPYNLLNRSAEEELFPAAQYEKMGVMTYSPLAAGLLGGAFAENGHAPEKSTWSYDPCYRAYLRMVFPGKIAGIVNAVAGMAQKYCATSAQIATAWVLSRPEVTCAISGADSETELTDSLNAASMVLEPFDLTELERLSYGMRAVFSHPEVQRAVAAQKLKEGN